MIVACGFDHAGFPLRDRIVAAIEADGHEVLDLGTHTLDPIRTITLVILSEAKNDRFWNLVL